MLCRHIHAMQTHTCYADTYMLCRQYVSHFNCVCGLCWLQNLPQFFNKSILAKLHAVYTHGALMHRPGYLRMCACGGSSTVALGRDIDGSFTACTDTCIIAQEYVYIFVQMLLATSVDSNSCFDQPWYQLPTSWQYPSTLFMYTAESEIQDWSYLEWNDVHDIQFVN